ncbi:MAG TPA: efflux RND transporter periplasmic adaptor subunit, partial [Usitatibacter sp.]|nr:efflux RND transporter periplasmic adaptor subunit [Usitatibacter sp.]
LVLAAAGGYGLWSLGMSQGMKMAAGTAPDAGGAQKAGDVDRAAGRKLLYWHDPMVPAQRFDKPGKSPFMDMMLVPVYEEGAAGGAAGVAISPRVQENLGIRTAEVTRGNVAPSLQAVGTVAWNDRDAAVVQARANGFLEKLHVRAPLDRVRKGEPLAELYVPDWVAAQEEFLSVARMQGDGLEDLREAARQRMRLAGMNDEQIRLVASGGKAYPRLALTAPIAGVVSELNAREGMTVMAGAPLFRINGLSTVWVNAEVPEAVASQVRPGNRVTARATALPDRQFDGRVGAILPEVNPATRTLKVRIELANPRGELVPGMFATVDFAPGAAREALMVPAEAVIRTGERSVVVLAETAADGRQQLRPVDVNPGVEANGFTEIRQGLAAGQKVVVSGQFLVDSEANLKATATRMSGAPSAPAAPATHSGEGLVEKIGAQAVTISHGPIASMQWGPMTMEFKLPDRKLASRVKEGDRVAFQFKSTPQGEFEITALQPVGTKP